MPETIQLSRGGPNLPTAFLDSILASEVVFLCGAGVSAPQMPSFEALVDQIYDKLPVARSPSERSAFAEGRFEEVLDSLERRLSNPSDVRDAVADLLRVPRDPSLKQHSIVLRLSRRPDNRVSVVTTNFDTLFERAAKELPATQLPKPLSHAGQALPAPGSPPFSGIIHLHGRLADDELESTPLVLTSADYGDAYLRSGWASRFLFDLVRCNVIALLGYSANDAPVRYILNVLQADRARFPDLHRVFAFDAYEYEEEEVLSRWGTLAVEPIPYCKTNRKTGAPDHSPLWDSLAQLTEIAEGPKRWRRQRAHAILQQPATDIKTATREELNWLFRGRSDLWSAALDAIRDPEWFTLFQEANLWTPNDAVWVPAAWVSKDFKSRGRLSFACKWQRRFGRPFTERIEQRLRSSGNLGDLWVRAWRLFCDVEPVPLHSPAYHAMQERIETGVVLASDLQQAVQLLAPKLELDGRPGEPRGDDGFLPIDRLTDIVSPRMVVADLSSATILANTLCTLSDRALEILGIATAALRSSLALETDLGLISEEYDPNDTGVPSVEEHPQNEHHGGVNLLVRVLAASLPHATVLDREHTRLVVAGWPNLQGRTGLRLALHAMRDPELFEANEALSTLLSISDVDFWSIRRETTLLLRHRSAAASRSLVQRIEDRVLYTAGPFYNRYAIESGQTDWRQHARDSAVWLRLNMLEGAGVLSGRGYTELQAIKERRDYLHRQVEDRDFFGAYVGPIQVSTGDPAPIEATPENDRLGAARTLALSPDPLLRQSWPAFCRSDPQGAFDLLHKKEITAENAPLWSDFLAGLSIGADFTAETRSSLAENALQHLHSAATDVLPPMLPGLSNLIFFASQQGLSGISDWANRLWPLVDEHGSENLAATEALSARAINSSAGNLAQAVVFDVDTTRRQGLRLTDEQSALLRLMADDEGRGGQLARAVFIREVGFLLTVDEDLVVSILRPRLSKGGDDAAALRATMITRPLGPAVCACLAPALKKGAVESGASHETGPIAANLLRPALADTREDTSVSWGLTAADVAQVLRVGPPELRAAALHVLAHWLRGSSAPAEKYWRASIAPLLSEIWPKERTHRDILCTQRFIDLVVWAGSEFPSALALVSHYLVPFEGRRGNFRSLMASGIASEFPNETLELLWLVCGRRGYGASYDLAKVIDQLIAANPDIETDRRLQWLEQHTERLD